MASAQAMELAQAGAAAQTMPPAGRGLMHSIASATAEASAQAVGAGAGDGIGAGDGSAQAMAKPQRRRRPWERCMAQGSEQVMSSAKAMASAQTMRGDWIGGANGSLSEQ